MQIINGVHPVLFNLKSGLKTTGYVFIKNGNVKLIILADGSPQDPQVLLKWKVLDPAKLHYSPDKIWHKYAYLDLIDPEDGASTQQIEIFPEDR